MADTEDLDVENLSRDEIIKEALSSELSKKSWKNNSLVVKDDIIPSFCYTSLSKLVRGSKLNHNAFIFDGKYLELTAENQISTSGISNAVKFQIALGMPAYYRFGKKFNKTIHIKRIGDRDPVAINLKLPDPSDVFIPENTIDIYASAYFDENKHTYFYKGIPTDLYHDYLNGQDSANILFYDVFQSFHGPTGFNIAQNTFTVSSDKNTELIISGYNEVLAKDYLCDIYDTIRLNLNARREYSSAENEQVLPTFLRMLLLHFCADVESYKALLPLTYFSDSSLNDYITNQELMEFFRGNTEESEDLLQRLYVYVQAPFVADYVDEENFGQELTPKSNIGHKNITASDNGSVEYFESIEGKHDEDNQVKYFPQQVPLKDALYDKYYSDSDYNRSGTIGKEAYNTSSNIADIELPKEVSLEDEYADIGGIPENPGEHPVKPVREDFDEEEEYQEALDSYRQDVIDYNKQLKAYNEYLQKLEFKSLLYKLEQAAFLSSTGVGSVYYKWINPYAAETEDNIIRNYSYFNPALKDVFYKAASDQSKPRILPESGNLIIDGRIISPTTDEFWYMIKKIISGRSSDIIQSDSASYVNSSIRKENNLIDARSISDESDKQESVDTRIKEVLTTNFKFKDADGIDRFGDPITTKVLSENGVISTSKITEYLTQPTVNLLYVLPYLSNRLEERFNINKASNVYDILPKDLIKPLDESDEHDYTYSLLEGDEANTLYRRDFNFSTEVHSVKGDRWSPRLYPMSLRELEANIYGNRLNIESVIEWIDNDFTATGSYNFKDISKEEPDDIQSTIFQLHKKYNKKFVNPNTLFNLYHKEDEATELKEFIEDPRENYSDSQSYKADFGININLDHAVIEEEAEVVDSDKDSRKDTYKRLPVLKEFYAMNIDDSQYKFDASKVVLCADGEYHYINSSDGQVRFQVLRNRY